ncbi:MAG: hypothetical protein ABI675_18365 [Chitinophagaceae bacterium]
MKNDLLPSLRKELENNFGRKVLSSRDCLQMVDDIYQKTGYTINTNTLRRFFGLIKTDYNASPSTLAILLKYCGFNSIDELQNISLSNATGDSIVNKEEVHHFLVSLFKNLNIEEDHSAVIDPMVNQTILFLERNPSMIEKFQREIADTTAGQYYYFERAVNMDRLNGYYGDGLRLYLRAKNNNEASIFANSIQVFRYWLTYETEQVETAMSAIRAITVTNSFPPHIFARYIGARLYYSHIKGEAIDKIMAEASKYYMASISRSGILSSDFELIVTEALILTNHYTEGREYIKKGRSRLSGTKKSAENENLFSFWEKMINSKKNTALKAILAPPKPNLNPVLSISPLTKRYYTILNWVATFKTKSTNFSDLIRETGFYRLS